MLYKFNDEFTAIIPDIKYLKLKSIPSYIKSFVKNKLANKEDYKYCYEKTFYAFKKESGIILLYEYMCKKSIKDLRIQNIYYLTENGLQELINNKFYSYIEFHKMFILKEERNFDYNNYEGYLYPYNLDILKELNYYKYIPLWNLKEYYKKNKITLNSITFFPLCCPEFEYLIKMKLYNLAHTIPYKFNKRSFKENFGIEKSNYYLMQELDITENGLSILKLDSKLSKDEIKFYSYSPTIAKTLSQNINLKELYKYFKEKKLKIDNLYQYCGYIELCLCFKLNLKNKKILYPDDLITSYYNLETKYNLIENKETNKKIKTISKILDINRYEDEKYIIYPARSLEDIINESNIMHNCLRDYSIIYSQNESQIYFMRLKEKQNKPLVDIEIKDNKIVQAYMKFNKPITDEIKEILKKWEQNLIPIYNI